MRDSSDLALLRLFYPIGTMISPEKTGLEGAKFRSLISSLQRAGFVFNVTEREFSLLREPELLSPHAILARLRTNTIGRDVIVFRETSSTNDRVKQAGLFGANEGLAIFAETQSNGRGTYGRKWVSRAGDGLWFSILLRSRILPNELPWLVRLAAVACAEVIERSVAKPVRIKPPNDLFLENGKLAGFLLETSNDWNFQVLGIGINIRSAPLLPGSPTAAMDQFSRTPISRNSLAAELLEGLENWYLSKSSEKVELAFESRSSM
jgi:BirA family transcriptional regulator, biotin operon repressor / biotin---[acetyl-CoA-carboxylase] ligase